MRGRANHTRPRQRWQNQRCLALMVGLLALATTAAAQPAEDGAAGVDSTAGREFTAPGQSGAALPEITVEAQNQVRQQIEKSDFEFVPTASAVDSFFSVMDEEALDLSPVSGLQPHLNNLEMLASDQPPHCWLREMASAPVVVFYPEDPEGHEVRSWTLTITDFRGAPFKRFAGDGSPPPSIAWDGRGDQGQMLRVGYPYSYVFSLTDTGTNNYNYAGVSFRIPALDHRDEGHRRLELAGGRLFARGQAELTPEGRNWLTRAADEVRRHPYSPVRVQVTAEEEALASERADVVAAYLATSMILPREQIETEAIQKVDLKAEMDGSVAIVIEHAD
jgi:hypothetical protein